METIKNYLDNLFQSIPKTEEVIRLKNDLLANMEDKYTELKKAGKTENEAIGIVIAEFGNIDELLNEMGFDSVNSMDFEKQKQGISASEARDFIQTKIFSGKLIGIGVALIMAGASLMIFLYNQIEQNIIFTNISGEAKEFIPVILLLISVVMAVPLFIYSGMKEEPYHHIDEGKFSLTSGLRGILQNEYKKVSFTGNILVIIGVSLCILSPISIFTGSLYGETGSIYGVSVLLLIVAAAVLLFIIGGSKTEAYKKLLKTVR